MKKITAFLATALALAAVCAAPAARADYADAPPPAPEAAVEQFSGAAPLAAPWPPPTPVPGNRIFYWRDAAGSVVGLAEKGQLVWLEIPAGVVHVGAGIVRSGYAIDSMIDAVTASVWDVYDDASGVDLLRFAPNVPGSTTYPGRLIGTPLVVKSFVRSADGVFRLTNVWSWVPGSRALALRQVLKNVSPASTAVTWGLKNLVDVDLDIPLVMGTENFARSSQALTAWVDPADAPGGHTLVMSQRTPPSFLNTPPFGDAIYKTWNCCTAGPLEGHLGGVWTVTGDYSFFVNNFESAATFGPGTKKVFRFDFVVR